MAENMLILKFTLMSGFFVVSLLKCHAEDIRVQSPNIIAILADDMGWSDASYHGSNLFPTPNIDALAYNGINLHQFHSPSLCTPSRAALMTGKFPIKIGMQRLVILEAEPWGLPTSLKILPQYLETAGYERHAIGKWHLGFCEEEYTPTFRGFESFVGFYQGHIDYFSHESKETFSKPAFVGHDFNENLVPRKDLQGIYASDIINDKSVELIQNHDPSKPLFLYLSHIAPHSGEKETPLQAPKEVIENFLYIPDEDKRIYAAMVSKLDEGVGRVMQALSHKNMLENSIILFISDNGAPTKGIYGTTGSNWPFRGMKQTEFEGGTRVNAVMWSPLFRNQQRVSNIMMHMVDVLPTLCTAAGVDPENFQDIDGISMWETLMTGSENSLRTEFPHTIDPAGDNDAMGAVRVGDWKYYQGDYKRFTDVYLWPGDKYPNSDYEKYGYDPSKILQSRTNRAIGKVYQRLKVPQEPLTADKILQLRSEMKIVCPSLDLPECDATESCLLNPIEDPCERYDFGNKNPEEFENMKLKFEDYRKQVVPPLNKPKDECANPKFYDGNWVPWLDSNKNPSKSGISCFSTNFISTMIRLVNDYIYDPILKKFLAG